ncbi:MAG: exodeoxyribonuclease VII large subunit [bacterium]|nr:exodeoxyribonuclease VII large subunit [bacterium]
MNWETVVINGKEVSIAFDENSVHVYNAFPIKDDLKIRGYRWNPADKSWYVSPGSIDDEMAVLKNNLKSAAAPAGDAPLPASKSKSPLSRFPDSLSVADLRNRIDRLIRDGIRGNVWVRGVIASDVKNYKWASYLDLKDEDEGRNMFFRVDVKKLHLQKINKKLEDTGVAHGLEKDLPVFCNVEVYLPLKNVVDVRLSLVDVLPEYTQSKIRNQREITLDKLKEEGILENQKRLILPPYISNIGLITSELGTSIRDIRAGLHPFEDKYDFLFTDSRMEGSHAVESIKKAISFLEKEAPGHLDAIIIARGGGSEQSLAVFNDLKLCRKVCLSPIPILTAIGHEKDVSAIEQVSWLTPTPSTPSGIGKYLQNRVLTLREQLSTLVTQLFHHFSTAHNSEMTRLKSFLEHIPARVSGAMQLREERLVSTVNRFRQSASFTVKTHEQQVGNNSRLLMEKYKAIHTGSRKNIARLAESSITRASAGLRFKEERFHSLARGFQQSASFKVKENEGLVKRLVLQIQEKSGDMRTTGHREILGLTKATVSRASLLNARETGNMKKTLGRLDFDRRFRINQIVREDLHKRSVSLLALAARNLETASKDLEARRRLARAADPMTILEKGFTLVLDEHQRVIPSLKHYEEKDKAVLKFHDGTIEIKKENANDGLE